MIASFQVLLMSFNIRQIKAQYTFVCRGRFYQRKAQSYQLVLDTGYVLQHCTCPSCQIQRTSSIV